MFNDLLTSGCFRCTAFDRRVFLQTSELLGQRYHLPHYPAKCLRTRIYSGRRSGTSATKIDSISTSDALKNPSGPTKGQPSYSPTTNTFEEKASTQTSTRSLCTTKKSRPQTPSDFISSWLPTHTVALRDNCPNGKTVCLSSSICCQLF